MDRFLLITFLSVNWSHLVFSKGKYNVMLFSIMILVLRSEESDSAICDLVSRKIQQRFNR